MTALTQRDAQRAPDWLVDELHANAAFVLEAISNHGTGIAKAHADITSGRAVESAVDDAVNAWIVHWWEFRNHDAEAISREWKRYAQEAA
jgi:hypothetical protein